MFCRTDTEKLERREQTLKEMLDFIPDMAVRVMGTERHEAGITLLFELLQQPRLNKQVSILLTHPTLQVSILLTHPTLQVSISLNNPPLQVSI